MAKLTLNPTKRSLIGKKVKNLRNQGFLPANIFGKGLDSVAVSVRLKDFQSIYKEAGETQLVYLQLEGEDKERPVLIGNVQYDPVTDKIFHIDFHQVNLKEKVTANIPVELIGESPAAKEFQAVVVANISEIEVEALPTDLPENIPVDISVLKVIGDSIKISDLDIDRSKVEVLTDPETIIVSAAEQQKEEIIAPPVTEEVPAGEVPPTEEGKEPTSPTTEQPSKAE